VDAKVYQAQATIERFKRQLRFPDRGGVDPARKLDDVLEILRADELDRFAAGLAFASQEDSLESLALQAQIELAWGGGQLQLSEVLTDAAQDLVLLSAGVSKKVQEGKDQTLVRRLHEMNRTVRQTFEVAEAFATVAPVHLARGISLAERIMAEHPDSYLGYRVAADYFRIQRDWSRFGRLLEQIEDKNPDSNGLVFLRGMRAYEERRDPIGAIEFFKEALRRDPKFARAQAQIVHIRSRKGPAHDDLATLERVNPHHPMVLWSKTLLQMITAARES
jgi:tetratricopeptide (TPR) repeat protein